LDGRNRIHVSSYANVSCCIDLQRAFCLRYLLQGLKGGEVKRRLDYVKFFGLLALVTGVLGQLIGMFMAFQAIEQIGEVSQAMLAGGLKVSSITSIYGMLIFVVTRLIWFGLHYKANK
jgi:hypothetical protein